MKTNKYLFLSASALLSVVALAGCGGKTITEDVDTTKTTLYVKYNNGGMGNIWINKLDEEFEEMFKDYSFEKGKVGVQVIRDDTKRNISHNDVAGNKNMVYIQENNNYSEYLGSNAMLDITSLLNDYAVTGADTKESERKIIDKIDQTYKDYLNYNDKYYAVPLFDANVGLTYNVDLFESKGLYMRKGASADAFTDEDFKNKDKIYELFVDDEHTDRSYGPDGKTGVEGTIDHTIDDGLPATYKDFKALVEMMKWSNVTPFIWNNTDTSYLTSLTDEIWATNVGKEDFLNHLKMAGTSSSLVKIENNKVVRDVNGKPVTETMTVSKNNYYELHRQEGKLEALEFVQTMVEDGNYYKDSWTTSFTTALEYFVNPHKHPKVGDIGMIVEGSWFLEEAAKASCFNGSKEKQKNAKFSPMVLPKATADKIGTEYVRTSDRKSLMFISNFIKGPSLEVAKKYFSFLQSDHALQVHTLYTHNPRAMIYDMPDDVYEQLSYYGQRLWDITKHYESSIVPFLPMTEEAKRNENALNRLTYGFQTATKDGNPVKNFFDWKAQGVKVTPEQYFIDIYNFKKGI